MTSTAASHRTAGGVGFNRRFLSGTLVAAVLATTLAALSLHARAWVGFPFPGFLAAANGVIQSGPVSDWPLAAQPEVLALDGTSMATALLYASVREKPAGTPFHYTLRDARGDTEQSVIASRKFTVADYLLTFGAPALNGVLCLLIGIAVYRARPAEAAAGAFLAATVAGGTLLLTELGLAGSLLCLRLHALAQALLPATVLHLAVVFPIDRLRSRRLLLLFAYLPSVVLAGVYQLAIGRPGEYAILHLIASAGLASSALVLFGVFSHSFFQSPFPLVRRRLGLSALGALGTLLPAFLLFGATALVLDERIVHPMGLTLFLFPLALGYAIVKQDLFEIDQALRRSVTQAVAVLLVGSLQLAVLALLQRAPWLHTGLSVPATLALLSLGLLFVLDPVRERVRRSVDRVLLRHAYNAERGLMKLSHALAGAHTVDAVARAIHDVLRSTLNPAHGTLYLRDKRGFCRVSGAPEPAKPVVLPPALLADLELGRTVTSYRWTDGTLPRVPHVWTELRAEILVPMRSAGTTIGLIVCGEKHSQTAYNSDDVGFLQAAASQAALACSNASAFQALQELNANLERQVEERTAAVQAANDGLNGANAQLTGSLAELQRAYDQLAQNHACLLRAERLATLGRLTAGIAHEVNTPLSAVQNALKVLVELGQEYEASIDDGSVSPNDHREIAREIVDTARAATEWAQKAALFIRGTKVHGRNPGAGEPEPFSIRGLVNEARDLLMHRLRASGVQFVVEEEDGDVSLIGSRSAFSQVLLNLVTNALDAYEDAGTIDGRVTVRISHHDGTATVEVQDRAGGIPLQVLPRIFEEMFTTKGPGRGTGLGLWISRTIVEKEFGGLLDVMTSPGEGSRFIATMPVPSPSALASEAGNPGVRNAA